VQSTGKQGDEWIKHERGWSKVRTGDRVFLRALPDPDAEAAEGGEGSEAAGGEARFREQQRQTSYQVCGLRVPRSLMLTRAVVCPRRPRPRAAFLTTCASPPSPLSWRTSSRFAC
jgi:hypothetical protein